MGTTYTAKVTVRCWKQHTCGGCGKGYRYRFQRTKTGQGNSPYLAEKAVEQAVMTALEHEVDMHACPSCGLYQADMVGSQRNVRHWWLVGIAAACFLIMLAMAAFKAVTLAQVSYILAGIGGVYLVAQYVIYKLNPNQNPEGNLQVAKRALELGAVEICPAAPEAAVKIQAAPVLSSPTAMLLFGVMVLAVLGIISAEAYRTVNGWPYNPTWYPPVAGPGDMPRAYFNWSFQSVKGLWKGRTQVTLLNAQELGYQGPPLRAATNSSPWGQTISVKSSEKSSTVNPWIELEIPQNPALANKVLKIDVLLEVEYPKVVAGGNSFAVMEDSRRQTAELRLGTANAGATYNQLWWGALGGSLMLLGAGFGLTRVATGLRRQALLTSVVPCEAATEE
jgi:hypothetical protein